jgi:hypothetical protein
MALPLPMTKVNLFRILVALKAGLLIKIASSQLPLELVMHSKIQAGYLFQFLFTLNLINLFEQLQVFSQVRLSLPEFLLISTLPHHVVSEAHVYLLGVECGVLPECLLPEADAVLIGVLRLLRLLELFVHVAPLFVDGTDQIGVVQLLEDAECLIQALIGLALLKEFPIEESINAADNAMMFAFLVLLVAVYNLSGFLKIFFGLL